jgi:DNA-binding MarR family transcriptional regulator
MTAGGGDIEIEPEVGLNVEMLRHEHIGRLLVYASRVFERMALKRMNDLGFSDLRMVHLVFIRSLRVEGSRTTDVAESANMTKQAVGQLAAELEIAGYVTRVPDPADGRARLVKYTGKGLELMAHLPGLLHDLESDIETAIGRGNFSALRRTLRRMIAMQG